MGPMVDRQNAPIGIVRNFSPFVPLESWFVCSGSVFACWSNIRFPTQKQLVNWLFTKGLPLALSFTETILDLESSVSLGFASSTATRRAQSNLNYLESWTFYQRKPMKYNFPDKYVAKLDFIYLRKTNLHPNSCWWKYCYSLHGNLNHSKRFNLHYLATARNYLIAPWRYRR